MILKRYKTKPVVTLKSTGLVKKKLTAFRINTFSRHPSHSPLRTRLPLLPFRSVVRMGSTTPSIGKIECNTVSGVMNSSSKLLMKQCFTRAGVKTADWWTIRDSREKTFNQHIGHQDNISSSSSNISDLPYPIIAKSHFGSRGNGNTKLDNQRALEEWMRGKTLSNYIFERFYSYSVEFRIHCTSEGAFYSCRKMLKRDAPTANSWQRHDDNCVWILETNPSFDKPSNWSLIVADCVRALNSLGLDIGAFDVKCQSNNDARGRRRESVEWIVLESCSAPSFGDITTEKYLIEIPKVLRRKYAEQRS